jgi:hypothetical protein
MVFKADPNVCTSRAGVRGGMRVCTILKEPSADVDSVGERAGDGVEGMYIRRGMCFSGIEGFKRMFEILE